VIDASPIGNRARPTCRNTLAEGEAYLAVAVDIGGIDD
jgi:hypothetical protein